LAIIEEIKRSQAANRHLKSGSNEKNMILKNATVQSMFSQTPVNKRQPISLNQSLLLKSNEQKKSVREEYLATDP
jgi:hypothetical protein